MAPNLKLREYGPWQRQRRGPGRKQSRWALWIACVGPLFLVSFLSLLVLTNHRPVVLSQEIHLVSTGESVPARGASSLTRENMPLLAQGALPSTEHPLVAREFSDCELLDFDCYFKEALTAFGNLLYENVKPLLNSMVTYQGNFITQTPPSLTYEQEHVQRVANWALTVVDLSLLVLVAFAGYQIMLGRSLGWQTADAMTLLPRIIVAVILAHSWELVCGLLIDFSNLLSLGVIDLLHTAFLAEVVASLKTLVPTLEPVPIGGPTALLITLVLALFLIIQLLLLIWQMLVRLALIMVLVALSPLGLGCLASSLTEHWGHLWISLFVHTVMVQFLQVTALALAGMFTLVIVNEDIFGFDRALALQLVSTAMFYLVLRLPALLSAYMPSPLVQAGMATGNAISGALRRAAASL